MQAKLFYMRYSFGEIPGEACYEPSSNSRAAVRLTGCCRFFIVDSWAATRRVAEDEECCVDRIRRLALAGSFYGRRARSDHDEARGKLGQRGVSGERVLARDTRGAA